MKLSACIYHQGCNAESVDLTLPVYISTKGKLVLTKDSTTEECKKITLKYWTSVELPKNDNNYDVCSDFDFTDDFVISDAPYLESIELLSQSYKYINSLIIESIIRSVL